MPTPPSARSIKIGDDERLGWSSDRPRPEGARARPADISVRCRVLMPSDRMRYSPGSLLVIACASRSDREELAQRVLENPGAVLSLDKVRGLLAGRVAEEEMPARAVELLDAAVLKRLEGGETTVLTAGVDPTERERAVRMAAGVKRPRHLVLLETGRAEVSPEDLAALNELRRALDTGELGSEGFQTALRLGGGSASELKRIVFRSAPREE